jgi:hypothetical protein
MTMSLSILGSKIKVCCLVAAHRAARRILIAISAHLLEEARRCRAPINR